MHCLLVHFASEDSADAEVANAQATPSTSREALRADQAGESCFRSFARKHRSGNATGRRSHRFPSFRTIPTAVAPAGTARAYSCAGAPTSTSYAMNPPKVFADTNTKLLPWRLRGNS